jgi:mannitol-1-phosphate/altronate dehydrogenase
VQYLNTVIGKMGRLVTDPEEISRMGLAPVAPGIEKAILVEEFNRILVTRARVGGFTPGIEVFIEKDDLLPFEEAKLYGHNAIQALLAYLGALKGYTRMTDLRDDRRIMEIAREAFLAESGAALRKRHHAVKDPLFTERGYEAYALDLLERMTNPLLNDTIERAGRDPVRKLGRTDRLFGTMSLALEHGIRPVNMALGAAAAIAALLAGAERNKVPRHLRCDDRRSLDDVRIAEIMEWLWPDAASEQSRDLIRHVQEARPRLAQL